MVTPKTGRRSVRFQSFAFDLDSRELSKEGRPVKLHPQPARVLALLLEQAGEIVDREEIQKKVWGDSHVDFDLGINSCIRQIRIALGDDAEKPQYVETVTREGYRFITPVEDDSRAETRPQKSARLCSDFRAFCSYWSPRLDRALA